AVPRDTRVPGMWLAACMLLSALVMAAALGVRSQVFSLVGVAVVLLVVRQWREGRRGVVWLLPPLFLLWANLDGGFIAGLAVLGVAALVAGPLDPSVIAPRRLLGTVLLASALATLLNPDAAGLYAHLVDAALHSPIGPALAATGSPDFHSTGARLFEVEAALLIAVWAAGGGPDRFDALVAGGALLATLLAQGSTGLFAVVAIPQLAVYGHRTW